MRSHAKDLLCRERKGDNDERPKDTSIEDDSPPSRRNMKRDIGGVESRLFGGGRGCDEDLRQDLVWKGNGRPPASSGRVGLSGTSFEHRQGPSVTVGVGNIPKQRGWVMAGDGQGEV